MTSAMMIDRTNMTGMGNGMQMSNAMQSASPNMVMVPRCTMKIEKCSGGMKVTCICDDAAACTMMQNLCTMMAGGLCSLSCMMNGMTVFTCNLTMGACKVEMTKDGCCVCCTSGDKACCEMIQACCDCLMTCMKNGSSCCMMMGGTPVCCCIC